MEKPKIYMVDLSDDVKVFCYTNNIALNSNIVIGLYNNILQLVDAHIHNDDAEQMFVKIKEIPDNIGVSFINNDKMLDFATMAAKLLQELTATVVENNLISTFRYASYITGETVVIEY